MKELQKQRDAIERQLDKQKQELAQLKAKVKAQEVHPSELEIIQFERNKLLEEQKRVKVKFDQAKLIQTQQRQQEAKLEAAPVAAEQKPG